MILRFRQTRIGQNLVEFALIAPLFFFVVFGIIEGGRLLWTFHTLSNAAKEGARYTTVRGAGSTQGDAPATAGKIENHIVSISTGLDPEDLHVGLLLIDGDMKDQSRFRVEVTYDYDFVVTAIFGRGSMQLNASSTDMFWREPDD